MISFSQNSRHENEVYRRLYNAADKYYHDAENNNISEDKQEQLNHDALTAFRNLVMKMETEKNVNDSLAFHSYFKIGILEHFFNNLPAAEKAYRHSIQLKQTLTQLPDSFLFKPQLYLGIVLYNENQFDSAVAAYKKAEVIAEAYSTPLQETERLYNTLGALYYETGNYRQAKNYLEKSVALLPKNHPYYKDLLVNYKINLASTLTKLEEYDEADKIYQSIFHFNILRDIILHNTGVINLNLGSIHKALQNFYQVNPAKTNSARLYNDMALAHYNLGHNDSARYYLDKASAQVRMDLSGKKTISYGQTLKIRGDLLLSEKKTADAILSYQQAIVQFYADFNEIIPAKNPVEYTGVFSYINLFNTLTAKADAYEQLNKVDKKINSLKSALDAYRSAFKLADYVERTYDSDEARLFLNKIKYVVHNRPISLCILLYDLTGEKEFLEEAYLFDQRNKGSVLAFSIHENEIKSKLGIGDLLSRQENSLKSAITRLSLKSAQVTDNKQLQELNSSIRDFEIQLGRIQEKINNTPGYEKMRSADRVPSVTDLQQKLLDNNTSLLSYHLTKTELLIICISKKEISYKKVPLKDSFFSALQSFVTSLHQVNSDIKYDAAGISQKLYAWLIQPVYEKISYANRLIIIPDDELNYVPFEALQNNEKKYLVESFAIQYQYSTSLLKTAEIKLASNKNIAFAPFFDSGYSLQNIVFSKLAYSGEEISGLKGKAFLNSDATKQKFINGANKFSVIHLATHAIVNDRLPLQSFIAFYPGKQNDSADYRLYAQEIYDMDLDSTSLVILSACETGAGQLIRGEGLMSLSRAFAYAGCPNIVTSLWKAEDKTTAFLTKKLHHYLERGYTIDKALQQAKLDLLKSDEIDPRLKSPNYWAHLLFIGNYEPIKFPAYWIWIIGIGVMGLLTFLLFKFSKRKSPA